MDMKWLFLKGALPPSSTTNTEKHKSSSLLPPYWACCERFMSPTEILGPKGVFIVKQVHVNFHSPIQISSSKFGIYKTHNRSG